jgi:hypothetical protein
VDTKHIAASTALFSLRPENSYCSKVQAKDAAMRINEHLRRGRPDQNVYGRHDLVDMLARMTRGAFLVMMGR